MAKGNDKTEKKASGGISIIALIVFSLLAAGSGAGFGFVVPDMIQPTASKPQGKSADEHADGHEAGPTKLAGLAPITTNLAKPSSTWIRLEAAIVVEKDLGPDAQLMASKISEDIVGYLRTVSIDQIEGPSGFQHLREDLNDRVRVRSEGKISELVITSMIVE